MRKKPSGFPRNPRLLGAAGPVDWRNVGAVPSPVKTSGRYLARVRPGFKMGYWVGGSGFGPPAFGTADPAHSRDLGMPKSDLRHEQRRDCCEEVNHRFQMACCGAYGAVGSGPA